MKINDSTIFKKLQKCEFGEVTKTYECEYSMQTKWTRDPFLWRAHRKMCVMITEYRWLLLGIQYRKFLDFQLVLYISYCIVQGSHYTVRLALFWPPDAEQFLSAST
jgi:hypothetical protein